VRTFVEDAIPFTSSLMRLSVLRLANELSQKLNRAIDHLIGLFPA
jgi:hypothetical protein